ncbi:unnamed protein product, partial [Amoebophrya sp. A25]
DIFSGVTVTSSNRIDDSSTSWSWSSSYDLSMSKTAKALGDRVTFQYGDGTRASAVSFRDDVIVDQRATTTSGNARRRGGGSFSENRGSFSSKRTSLVSHNAAQQMQEAEGDADRSNKDESTTCSTSSKSQIADAVAVLADEGG